MGRKRALGVDAGIYDADLYDAMCSFDDDLPFYLGYARKARGPVLEFCCGTGRLTLPMARQGINITGVDFTPSMLERAREKARKVGLSVPLIRGDMRKVRLGRKFGMIFIPFNSLQNTYTVADLEKVFANVKRHLAPGGKFLFDVFNPNLALMVDAERKTVRGKYRFFLRDGKKVLVDESCKYDSATQVNQGTWTFRIGKRRFTQRLDMRCIYPLELDALLRYNGFRIVRKFGDFGGTSFSSGSAKQVCVCEAAG